MNITENAAATKYVQTEISSTTSGPIVSTAPNGSSTGTDYYTTVTSVQDWIKDKYAGYSYTITHEYISPDPRHPRMQLINSTSTFLSGP